jgi:hypothetical protein
MKTNQAKRKPTTHFEQVPLAVVKKIADPDASNTDKAGPHNVIIEPASRKTEPYSMPAAPVMWT